ncbi:hypothetical protein MRB53_000596 [Persea americana]|uniref:Uncharacterized protein n=1 Tax=Persea americana TaxID=3435 RepID=A0ACC2MPK6_PERAE|nr:hypothetical protein MRB53_000596 [Persea americana]
MKLGKFSQRGSPHKLQHPITHISHHCPLTSENQELRNPLHPRLTQTRPSSFRRLPKAKFPSSASFSPTVDRSTTLIPGPALVSLLISIDKWTQAGYAKNIWSDVIKPSESTSS